MLQLIYKLKEKYNIYFLSNITDVTYNYMKNELKILDGFNGGIYSCKEHLMKPQEEIYELLINRYQLKKEETIFFDDTLENVKVGNKLGIKSIQIQHYRDVKEIL